MTRRYIELDRDFVEVSKDHNFDEESYESPFFYYLAEPKKWGDLLKLRRVIILAEAGSGKSREIAETTQKLRRSGKQAFFFRLEHLGSNFETAFEIGNNSEFNHWLSSNEEGWFFLDSVDEAKLKGPYEFKSAINVLALKLNTALQRANIYITGRFSEWHPHADLSFIKSKLPASEIKKIEEPSDTPEVELDDKGFGASESGSEQKTISQNIVEPKIFALRSLSNTQIVKYASEFGVNDTESFIREIQRKEADIFSGRPQDLEEIINYWNLNGRLGGRKALLEASIEAKLKEPDNTRATLLPLSLEDANYGARMLAAATTFTRKSRILIPDSEIDPYLKATAIDASKILIGWGADKIRALLQRPVFDQAVYGTVRFHVRIAREYLTAKWLNHLLENGKSRKAIENLFFAERYGERVLVPSMRAVLGWLILLDEKIRDKTSKLAPDIFIESGDPSFLPLDIRKSILKGFCERILADQPFDHSFDINVLRRFSHPDLGETINNLLKNYSHNTDLVEILLRMIWQGEIILCAEEAMKFAINSSNGEYVQVCGIRAVGAAGSEGHKKQVISSILSDQNLVSERVIGAVVSELFDILSYKEVVSLLSRIKNYNRFSSSGITSALEEFSENKILDADLIGWIGTLFRLMKQGPVVEEQDFEVSRKYDWLLPYAVTAVGRLIEIKSPDVFDTRCLEIISLSERDKHYDYSASEDLSGQASKWPELKWALFWFSVEVERNKEKRRVTEWWQAYPYYGRYWEFTIDDFKVALEYVNSKELIDDKSVALSVAFRIYKENGRGPTRRRLLKKSVAGLPELEATLSAFLNPPPLTEEQRKAKKQDKGFERRRKKRERDEKRRKNEWKVWITEHKHVLLDTSIAPKGEVWRATYYLMNDIEEDKDSRGTWAKANWKFLITEFGLEVAEAYRDGCIAYWRKFEPKIRSEGIDEPRKTPHSVVVGLSGIQMEADQDPDWPRKLSESEAVLACRYAVNELNGFPKWLPQLYEVFPGTVEKAILKEIEWEIAHYSDDEPCHYILDDVAWQADWLKPEISKKILGFLSSHEPKHDDTLEKALNIVLSSPEFDKEKFSQIALARIGSNISIYKKALWLAGWLMIDARSAYDVLLSTFNSIAGVEQANALAMNFAVTLIGEHGRGIGVKNRASKDYLQVEYLLKLIKLIHKYIKRSEDINRMGTGAYSPVLRDHAQRSRDQIFQLLCDIPGKETFLALMDLSVTHPDEGAREWCIVSAKRRAAADSEFKAWSERDTIEFTREAEKFPADHRELFDLAVSRLYDLKAELEDGERSLASVFVGVPHEREHRKYIGGWLRDRSNGKYSAPQEEEFADATKPDIRIHMSNINGPVPIEIKIVDNHSAAVLLERLRNQLCNQYLRDYNARCGIYLLVYRGKNYWEHPITYERLDFPNLVELLKEEAESIIRADFKVDTIEVIAIDLTKRKLGFDLIGTS